MGVPARRPPPRGAPQPPDRPRASPTPASVHIGSERVDILEPAAVRQIPRGRALLIMRSMPALIVHLKPAWKRPDWTTLQADATGSATATPNRTIQPRWLDDLHDPTRCSRAGLR